MAGYKVRLGDGSEIGPMDMQALKTWHMQGLIDGDSPVMKSGSRKWVPLGSLPEFAGAARSARSKGKKKAEKSSRTAAARDDLGSTEATALDALRVRITGVLLLLVAAGLALLAWRPELVRPAFDGAPWLEIALGVLALGLAVLPGWNLSRRIVRVVLLLGAFALFPVAGILIAQGERGLALLALLAAWLLISGLFALLAPRLGWVGMVLAILPLVAGAYGLVRFGRAPETEMAQLVRAWASGEDRFSDDAMGLTLDLRDGWVTLKPGNPLVEAPEGTRVTLAQPRLDGYGFLLAEPAPRGVATADQYLDHLTARRRAVRPSLEEQGRANAIIGALTGRRLDATWVDAEVRQHDLTITGQDGWMSFALVAWMPETTASRRGGLDSLAEGLSARGLLADRLRGAVQTAVEEVPHLSAPAAELLMSQSQARVLEPDQAFRRSVAALANLLPALSPAETRELSRLTRATYGSVPWKNRSRLAGYIERVRRGDTTDPAEDAEMAQLMKAAELELSPDQRLRLQAYYERAIRETS